MQQILMQESNSLCNPLRSLEPAIEADATQHEKGPARAMIINQLVYGDCAKNGRAMAWLHDYCEGYTVQEFVEDLCVAFADKASKESAAQDGEKT